MKRGKGVFDVLRMWLQFSGSTEKLTGSESVIDVPTSTAKVRALLRPRLSPLASSGSRRLAKAAPRRTLRRVHADDERTSLIKRARTSNADPYETTRKKGDSRGSCFVAVTARTMALTGRCRDPTHVLNPVSLEREDNNAKTMSFPP